MFLLRCLFWFGLVWFLVWTIRQSTNPEIGTTMWSHCLPLFISSVRVIHKPLKPVSRKNREDFGDMARKTWGFWEQSWVGESGEVQRPGRNACSRTWVLGVSDWNKGPLGSQRPLVLYSGKESEDEQQSPGGKERPESASSLFPMAVILLTPWFQTFRLQKGDKT